MLITMKPEQKKTGELKTILSRIGDIKARVISSAGRGSGISVHIKGMDAITTKEEMRVAIQKDSEVAKDQV